MTNYIPKTLKKYKIYQPPQVAKVTLDDNVDFKSYNEHSKKLCGSFKIEAIKCHNNGKVFRIKNSKIVRKLTSIFGIKKQNYSRNVSDIKETPDKFVIYKPKSKSSEVKKPIRNGNRKNKRNIIISNSQLILQPKNKNAKRVYRAVKFPNYLPYDEVCKGLQTGQLIKGMLRINPKNYNEAYVSNKDRSQEDYIINSMLDRNRALEGDVVVLRLKPEKELSSEKEKKQKYNSATVVYIHEQVHPRRAVGYVKLIESDKKYAKFLPRDSRVPPMKVPLAYFPPELTKNPEKFQKTLCLAKINEWRLVDCAFGEILEILGDNFDLEIETKALLLENELDVSPFPPEALQFVPKEEIISEGEFTRRRDLRRECIFTIDPASARDLDDAVSFKKLPNENVQVGVHISDVTHYLQEGTILDEIVRKKATSVYLVNDVYHMLPTDMCLHCSLLPGKEKVAMSVIWEMTPGGEIVKTEFTRTVIVSCAKLAYEDAQNIIENSTNCLDQLPEPCNGFEKKDLVEVVENLYRISVNLRNKRIDNGALQINQPKLLFRLDPESLYPIEWFVYENKEAHRLIEEFMLLANVSAAERIMEHFPDVALLRGHAPPSVRMMNDFMKTMDIAGIKFDISSSKAICASLRSYANDDLAKYAVLNHLLAKPMTRAKYLCASDCLSVQELHHYALSIPLYTHFTSPIRRYADVMVHRLLVASIDDTKRINWDVDYVTEIAANCNKQKFNAKKAGDASCDLFFAFYVEKNQPFVQNAVVVSLGPLSFDVLVIVSGTQLKLHKNSFPKSVEWTYNEEDSQKKIEIKYPETKEEKACTFVIKVFSVIQLNLTRKPKTNKLQGTLIKTLT